MPQKIGPSGFRPQIQPSENRELMFAEQGIYGREQGFTEPGSSVRRATLACAECWPPMSTRAKMSRYPMPSTSRAYVHYEIRRGPTRFHVNFNLNFRPRWG